MASATRKNEQRSRISSEKLGALGERAAARYLKRNQYRVLDRNLRLSAGEIDLLCLAPDRKTVVIVEVKSRRTSDSTGARIPEAAITLRKRRKLRILSEILIRKLGWEGRSLRIDVVAVEFSCDASARPSVLWRPRPSSIRHFEGAVGARS